MGFVEKLALMCLLEWNFMVKFDVKSHELYRATYLLIAVIWLLPYCQ